MAEVTLTMVDPEAYDGPIPVEPEVVVDHDGPADWDGNEIRRQRASEADRLQDATITGIANVTALLRRVTESRRGGVSRESQLRHLAQWFANLPGDEDAYGPPSSVAPFGDPLALPAPLSFSLDTTSFA